MTATDLDSQELTDPELISRVRDGDVAAYGTLFSRHVDAATRLARVLVGGPDADDLVSEAFVKVLNVLLSGGGPDVAFRAYLLTSVRRLHVDKIRSNQKLTTAGDMTPYDPGVPFTDPAIAGFEGGAAAKAFASLPERWQLVLWHLEVENQKPADIAPLLGMSANSVSALAYRAREGLRQAFLNMHSGDLVSEDCRETHELLGGYVRGALSRRDSGKVEDHLDHCRPCTAVYLELAEVNSSLAAVLGPALLGAAALGYLGGSGAAVGAGAGILVVAGRLRDAALGNLPATAATMAAVGVAGAVGIAVTVGGGGGTATARGDSDPPAAAPFAPSTSPAADPATDPSSGPRSGASPGGAGGAGGDGARRPAGAGEGTTGGNPESTTEGGVVAALGTGVDGATDAPATRPGEIGPAGPDGNDGNGQGNGNGNGNGQGNGNGHGHGNGSNPPGPTSRPTPTQPTKPPPTKPTDPPPTRPTDPPPTKPTDPPPPARTADIGLQAYAGTRGDQSGITVRVTGVPGGQSAAVTVTASSGDYRQQGPGCRRAGTGYSCTATSGRQSFLFHTTGRGRPTLTFSVSPPAGYTDTSSGNDRATVRFPESSRG